MKKIILVNLLMLVINIGLINAQPDKRKILLGTSTNITSVGRNNNLMNIGYSSVKNKNDDQIAESPSEKYVSVNLSPKVGYFVIDNLALGLDFNYAFYRHKFHYGSSQQYSESLLGAGPFIRYYISSTKVLQFLEVNSSFGFINHNTNATGSNSSWQGLNYKSSLMSFGAGYGLAVPLGKKVSFDTVLGFNSLATKRTSFNMNNNRTIYNTIGLKIGFTMFLGGGE